MAKRNARSAGIACHLLIASALLTMSNTDFLSLAHETGLRTVQNALWSGTECTWNIVMPDRSEPGGRKPMLQPASGGLYQGTAGIGLFLAELWTLTRDSTLLPALRGAAARTMQATSSMAPNSFAFHTGRTGAAYFFARLGLTLGEEQYVKWAGAVLAPIVGQEKNDRGFDVIGGSAGAIPALLQLSQWIELPFVLESVTAMGELLLKRARQGPEGWSWGGDKDCHRGGLAGFAHGASGFGYALLELYAVSGDERFRFAAQQAFFYERSLFQSADGNWLDLRNRDLMDHYLVPNGLVHLRDRLRAGETLPPYAYHCMSAWCHGAPGIGLTRLRAFQLLGEQQYLDEARIAMQTTADSLREQKNCSLCHGLSGNCETLLMASEILQEPSWSALVREVVPEKLANWNESGSGWPSGSTAAQPDPSLMMGDAGMGYLLLRLHSASVPSAVFLTAPASLHISRKPNELAIVIERNKYVDRYFARTIHIFDRLMPEFPSLRAANSACPELNQIAAVFEEACRRIEAETVSSRRALMVDAMAPERARYEAALAFNDLTIETLDLLRRFAAGEVDWETARFSCAPHLTVVECAYDWDAWLASDSDQAPIHAESPMSFVVFRHKQEMHGRPIGSFGATILRELGDGATIAQVTRAVMDATDAPDYHTTAWHARIQFQIQSMYQTGLIDVADAASGNELLLHHSEIHCD